MSVRKVWAIILMTLSAAVLVLSAPKMETHSLNELGTVGRKTYYYEKALMNSENTTRHCETSGLHMATLETLGELQLLDSNKNVIGYYSFYWIADKDTLATSQLLWNQNIGILKSSSNPDLLNETIQPCKAYMATLEGPRIYDRLCASHSFVLCQTIQNESI